MPLSDESMPLSGESIFVRGVGIGLVETGAPALEQHFSEGPALLRLLGVLLQAAHEGVVLGRALFFDDEHAGGLGVFPGEPTSRTTYSIPFDSSSVLLFLAVENMYDLLSIFVDDQ